MGFLISVFLPVSLCTMMLSLGLGLTLADFTRIARHPLAFAVGAMAQIVVMPIIAFAICHAFALPPELALGMMILSLCPGGPTSNVMTRVAHGDVALSITVTGVSSLAALVTLPPMTTYFARYFLGAEAVPVEFGALGLSMLLLTALPVVTGMLLRHYVPRFADRLDMPMRKLSGAMLILLIVGALASNWTMFMETLPVLGPSVAALGVCLIFAGLGLSRLAGLGQAQATAVAIDTGMQNAALGIAVGAIVAGAADGIPPLSFPSGVYAVMMYLLVVPFMIWRRRVAENSYSAASIARA